MDSWGCEFLDDGKHGSHPFVNNIIIIQEKPKSGWHYLPMEIVDKMIDKPYIGQIMVRDIDSIRALANSIYNIGLQNPGEIVTDGSKIRLQEGNHRYCAFKLLGIEEFPVILKTCRRISGQSISMNKFLQWYLERYTTHD
jgi:hypothetical protein